MAWISNERWNALNEKEQTQFPPLCPDFVLELVSVNDDLKAAKSKMQQELIANGCRLAWLIAPHGQTVHIYRENGEIQIVSSFDKKNLWRKRVGRLRVRFISTENVDFRVSDLLDFPEVRLQIESPNWSNNLTYVAIHNSCCAMLSGYRAAQR